MFYLLNLSSYVVKAALFKVLPSERRKAASNITSSLFNMATKMASGATEFKADGEAIAQFQKDKTQFQVFFSQIATQEDAAEMIEFINDVATFFTIPTDMLYDMIVVKMETIPKAATSIVDIVDACVYLREDVTSKVFTDDLISSLNVKAKECLSLAKEMDSEGISESRLSKLYNGAVPKASASSSMLDNASSWLGAAKAAKVQHVAIDPVPEPTHQEDRETIVDDVLETLKVSEQENAAMLAREAELEMQRKLEEDERRAGVMTIEGKRSYFNLLAPTH